MSVLYAIYPELCNIALQINKETGKQLNINIPITISHSTGCITICPKYAYDRELMDRKDGSITKKHFDRYIYLNNSKICFYSRRDPHINEDLEWTDPQLLDKLRRIMTQIADKNIQDHE